MTATMLAGVASEAGLAIREVPRPVPGPGQVLVRVRAAGMNRADLNAAKGAGVASHDAYGKPIGMEWAGEVVKTGPAVEGFRPGDVVMCSGSGGYAGYAVADAGRAIRLDGAALSIEQAGALPLALMTAHDALITNGRLRAGEAVLVHGASSAVGLMTLRLAALRGAATILGTSSSTERRGRLAEFGATHALDPQDPAWADTVLAATDGKGVNVTVDMVSGASVNTVMKVSTVRGRIINVGRLGGTKAEFDFDLHAAKRLDYVGVTFRTRSAEEVREIVRRATSDLQAEIASGGLALPIDSTYPLADAGLAHERMRANAHFGKIVLIP